MVKVFLEIIILHFYLLKNEFIYYFKSFMKGIILSLVLCLVPLTKAFIYELGQSYCLVCSDSSGNIVNGVQSYCRGTKKDCDIFGGSCDYCYIQNLEQKDIDLLSEYCYKKSGSNSINRKYKSYEVQAVNLKFCK